MYRWSIHVGSGSEIQGGPRTSLRYCFAVIFSQVSPTRQYPPGDLITTTTTFIRAEAGVLLDELNLGSRIPGERYVFCFGVLPRMVCFDNLAWVGVGLRYLFSGGM